MDILAMLAPLGTGFVLGIIVAYLFGDPSGVRRRSYADLRRSYADLFCTINDERARRYDAEQMLAELELTLVSVAAYCPRCHSLYPTVQHEACLGNPHDWHSRKPADA